MYEKIYLQLLEKLRSLKSTYKIDDRDTWFLESKIYQLRDSQDDKVFNDLILEFKKLRKRYSAEYPKFSEEMKNYVLTLDIAPSLKYQLIALSNPQQDGNQAPRLTNEKQPPRLTKTKSFLIAPQIKNPSSQNTQESKPADPDQEVIIAPWLRH